MSVVPLALMGAFLFAQDVPVQDAPNQDSETASRIRNVVLYGEEKCPPPATPDEIVVCAKGGDSPYRIPERFRERAEVGPSLSWARRVDTVMDANRAGLPGSCSPIGMGGQSGCTMQMMQQWAAERAEAARQASQIP
tara:strand:+ start:1500 stop:1910 length:411 start_codon:yes stop_codon:yes gene_type:complete